ncbi:hypothetical protein ACKWTF_014996 [Chironomus riparius]
MKAQNKSNAVLKVLILAILMTNLVSSQQLTGTSTNNLFNVLLSYLNEPNAQGGIRIQRMSSTTKAIEEKESAEASTIQQSNSIYQFPVIKITDANYTQFANQHEWIYVKFFTDWCPHSKKVIPAWHEVSYRLSSTPIAVAEIQCEVDDTLLCEKFKTIQ